MRIGACYYPEHWERARWDIDATMMRAAGFNLIRVAEFAWTRMEPSPGQFTWDWLDDALSVFAREGISAVLGTPTAAPPAWLMRAHPEIEPLRADGRHVHFGGRRHYCPNQPAFRTATARIVKEMGEHYARHPQVIGWQTDNEYGGAFHGGFCYCPECERGFQQWLEQRYQSLDALNAAWGTDFWSMRFGAWEEIPAPRETGGPHNPSLLLAWRRYYTDVWCNYHTFQADLLRDAGVTVPITTNLTGLSWGFDPYVMGEHVDLVAWDIYPIFCARDTDVRNARNYLTPALACDYMRAVNRGRPYWMTEQQSGAGGQSVIVGRTAPGDMRLWTYQTIAHGAETILYFRWRSCPFGAEQYWHGILQHDGRPNWRLAEATQVAGELHALPADLFTAHTPARVGVVLSAQQAWSHEIQSHVPGFAYQEEVLLPYIALRQAGVDVDVLYEGSDLSSYRLIVAPACQLLSPELAARLMTFVHEGGTLVLTYRSAVKNWEGVIFTDPLPGPLRDMLGITIDDTDALGSAKAQVAVTIDHPLFDRETVTGTAWADIITADTAEVVATFADTWYSGRPAITRQPYGAGAAWYLGTRLDDAFWQQFVTVLLDEVGVPVGPVTSEGIEIARRKGEREYTFVLNMRNSPGWVELTRPYHDLLTQQDYPIGRLALSPFAVHVLVTEA